jgi:hypothetical protein
LNRALAEKQNPSTSHAINNCCSSDCLNRDNIIDEKIVLDLGYDVYMGALLWAKPEQECASGSL